MADLIRRLKDAPPAGTTDRRPSSSAHEQVPATAGTIAARSDGAPRRQAEPERGSEDPIGPRSPDTPTS